MMDGRGALCHRAAVKILVLGNSDTEGLMSGGKTWTAVARDSIEDALGEPVTLHETRFFLSAAGAPEFAERKVREAQAELVILPVGTFSFTVGFVWVRVRDLFGERAGARYRRWEEAFDVKTLHRGPALSALNRAGRALTRTLIGTCPLTTREQLTRDYAEALRGLSRVEDVQVALVAYPGRGKYTTRGKAPAQRCLFLAAVRAEAQERHHLWVDSSEEFEARAKDVPTSTPDGFHLNEAGHRVLGSIVADAVLGAVKTREPRRVR